MNQAITVEFDVHFTLGQKGHRDMQAGEVPPQKTLPPGSVPRAARLMALAIRCGEYVSTGAVADYAELARLGYVTRARITQIMNLLNLAPDIQEEILFLPLTKRGRDPIGERDLRPIAALLDWRRQRKLWRARTSVYDSTALLRDRDSAANTANGPIGE